MNPLRIMRQTGGQSLPEVREDLENHPLGTGTIWNINQKGELL